MPVKIVIHIFKIENVLSRLQEDFNQRRDWIAYKKQQLHAYRLDSLSQSLGHTLTVSDLAKTDMGKPYLVEYPALAFNHSHSQLHYALAISRDLQDLGVDVEDLSRKVRFEALAQHAFHPDEYQHWVETGCDPRFWFQVWTSKEAVLKASGLGIRMSLNQLNTQCQMDQAYGRCQHDSIGEFAYQHIQQGNAFVTVAWRDRNEQAWPECVMSE